MDAIRDLIGLERYDAAYLHTAYMAQYLELLNGIPTVIGAYDAMSWLRRQQWSRARNPVSKVYLGQDALKWRRYEMRFYRRAASCAVVTSKDRDMLLADAPAAHCEVIPNGVELRPPCRPSLSGALSLVFTGCMDHLPNADGAIYLCREIFPRIRRQVPGAKLYIVGKNPTPDVMALARESDVVVTGFVSDVGHYLDQAAVSISPLRMGSGIKNKVLEAMAAGRAIVATPLSCDGINVTSGKDIILASGPQEFAGSVVEILQNGALRNSLGTQARALVEREHSWDAVLRRYERCLEEAGDAERRPLAGQPPEAP